MLFHLSLLLKFWLSTRIYFATFHSNKSLIIGLKVFPMKAANFKYPLSSLFKQLIEQTFGQLVKSVQSCLVKETTDEEVNKIRLHPEVSYEYDNEKLELNDFYNSCVFSFKTLIDIANGKKKEWVTPNVNSKTLGFEILIDVCQTLGTHAKFLPAVLNIINEDIKELIISNSKTNDFAIGIKLSRLILTLIQYNEVHLNLTDVLIELATFSTNSWQKIVGLESLAFIVGSVPLVKILYDAMSYVDPENGGNAFPNVLSALTKVSFALVNDKTKEKHKKKEEEIKTKFLTFDSYFIEGEVIVPFVGPRTITSLLLSSFTNLKDSYLKMCEVAKIKLGVPIKESSDFQNLVRDLIKFKYNDVKDTLTCLLSLTSEDGLVQSLLMIYQNLINITASLNLNEARDSYLSDLCNICIPNNVENKMSMSTKHILISKTILNISHCIPLLEISSWQLIFGAMQKIHLVLLGSLKFSQEYDIHSLLLTLETNMKKYHPNFKSIELSKEGFDDEMQEATEKVKAKKKFYESYEVVQSGNEDDLEILRSAIDTMFINSHNYDSVSLNDIIKALNATSDTIIANINSGQSADLQVVYLHFNVSKVFELAVINISRIPELWTELTNISEKLIVKGLDYISKFMMDTFTIVIMFALLQYQPSVKGELSLESWQSSIFDCYNKMLTQDVNMDLNYNLIICVRKILQNCGSKFDSNGWTNFIDICIKMCEKNDSKLVEQAFNLVETTINQFVDCLSCYNVKTLVVLLEKFAKYEKNINFSFLAISKYWDAADLLEKFQNIAKNKDPKVIEGLSDYQKIFFQRETNFEEFFEKEWDFLFSRLEIIGNDPRFEVRKTAISIFCDIFCVKTANLTTKNVKRFFNDYFSSLLDTFNKKYDVQIQMLPFFNKEEKVKTKKKKADQEDKTIEQTLYLLIYSIGKITRCLVESLFLFN